MAWKVSVSENLIGFTKDTKEQFLYVVNWSLAMALHVDIYSYFLRQAGGFTPAFSSKAR